MNQIQMIVIALRRLYERKASFVSWGLVHLIYVLSGRNSFSK